MQQIDLFQPAANANEPPLSRPSQPGETRVAKIISIRQPWAWLIIRPDVLDLGARAILELADEIKCVENRDWYTNYRGEVLIHAARAWGVDEQEAREMVMEETGIAIPEKLDLGGIIGRAEVYDCVKQFDSRWFYGPWGHLMRNQTPVPFTPLRGMPGYFDARVELPR